MQSDKKTSILVIDDSEIVREMVRLTLSEAGYEVHTLDTQFATAPAIIRERPALVLLDVSMPGLDGDRIVEIMRRNNGIARDTVVVLHSDKPEPELRQIANRCGADGYIQKTIDQADFVRQVAGWIDRGARAGSAG